MNLIKKQLYALYALYALLASIIGFKYIIESKPYRKLIYLYFRREEWNYETSITYIKTFKKGNKTIIEIETHRPGLLIGKGGRFIDGLKKYLIEETKEEIVFYLHECKLWHNLIDKT